MDAGTFPTFRSEGAKYELYNFQPVEQLEKLVGLLSGESEARPWVIALAGEPGSGRTYLLESAI